MKKLGIVIFVIAIVLLVFGIEMLYHDDILGESEELKVQTEKIAELEKKISDLENRLMGEESEEETENSIEPAVIPNVEWKEGIYANFDNPEAHTLTFSNGTVTYEATEKYVGTYTVEENKVNIVYTEAYDLAGNVIELLVPQETYRIDGDALVQDEKQIVYKLQ